MLLIKILFVLDIEPYLLCLRTPANFYFEYVTANIFFISFLQDYRSREPPLNNSHRVIKVDNSSGRVIHLDNSMWII